VPRPGKVNEKISKKSAVGNQSGGDRVLSCHPWGERGGQKEQSNNASDKKRKLMPRTSGGEGGGKRRSEGTRNWNPMSGYRGKKKKKSSTRYTTGRTIKRKKGEHLDPKGWPAETTNDHALGPT